MDIEIHIWNYFQHIIGNIMSGLDDRFIAIDRGNVVDTGVKGFIEKEIEELFLLYLEPSRKQERKVCTSRR